MFNNLNFSKLEQDLIFVPFYFQYDLYKGSLLGKYDIAGKKVVNVKEFDGKVLLLDKKQDLPIEAGEKIFAMLKVKIEKDSFVIAKINNFITIEDVKKKFAEVKGDCIKVCEFMVERLGLIFNSDEERIKFSNEVHDFLY